MRKCNECPKSCFVCRMYFECNSCGQKCFDFCSVTGKSQNILFLFVLIAACNVHNSVLLATSKKRILYAFTLSHSLSFSLFLLLCFLCSVFEWADGIESGRLFVWGENQFGQLATGTTDIVTKPSCVKVIKNLGYKVRTIAFGEAFSVILTGQWKLLSHFVIHIHKLQFFRSFRGRQTHRKQ